MEKPKVFFLLFLYFFGFCGFAGRAELSPEAARAIDTFVQHTMQAEGTPGLTLAVTTDTALLYVGTYGFADLKTQKPVAENTLFQIGSVSKSFTALGLLMLQDRGLLNMETPVANHLPWFEVRSSYPPIQVHHLLTHSAGIPANRDNMTHSLLTVAALRDQTAAWRPGERFHYSNVGYQTLHFLLEKITGVNYGEFIERQILKPLGMENSRPIITLESRAQQAVGYVHPYDDRPHHRSRLLAEAPHFDYWIGDGSIQSTARDMAAYIRMLLKDGEGPLGRLVSAEAFERFSTAHIPVSDETGYGYGIRVSDRKGRAVLEHSGSMVGFAAYLQADRTNWLGAVVLVNGPGQPQKVVEYSLAVARASLGKHPIPDPPETAEPTRIENGQEYAGLYKITSGPSLLVTANDSRLFIEGEQGQRILERRGKDIFYSPYPTFDRYYFHFLRDNEGGVNRFSHGAALFWREGCEEEQAAAPPPEWQSYTGRYRSYSPWLSYLEVIEREGNLILVKGEGGESTSGETQLIPLGAGVFRIGKEASPERLSFERIVAGQALKAVWSGHPLFRVPEQNR